MRTRNGRFFGVILAFVTGVTFADAQAKAVACPSCKKPQAFRSDLAYRLIRPLARVSAVALQISATVVCLYYLAVALGNVFYAVSHFGSGPYLRRLYLPAGERVMAVFGSVIFLSLVVIAAYYLIAWAKAKATFTCRACHHAWKAKNGPGLAGLPILWAFVVLVLGMAGVMIWATYFHS